MNRYKFLESRSGEVIPAWVDNAGGAHPLHSLVDPQREGDRLLAAGNNEGFIIILGLGGAYAAAAALGQKNTRQVLVIDYDLNGMAELLCSKEYIGVFSDSRFQLLVDAPAELIEGYILDSYQPILSGGIRTLPLRTRTVFSTAEFSAAAAAVEAAINAVSADYSVQAWFGTRWFSNIIRNILRAENAESPLPPIREAIITAAGPSLDSQLPEIKAERQKKYLIATDTSLPALLSAGMEPDAVVSIDCQHISYYHFMEGLPEIPLFLDLASPPLVASFSAHPRFFSGGHPLTRFVSLHWRPLPAIDTAGANVTYAALSLAEYLGAARAQIYGADFSYPLGRTYARGTYIHGYFDQRQNRLQSLEARYSAFLYRSPLEKQQKDPENWYYETGSLKRYRQGLEEKIRSMAKAGKTIIPAAGLGAPIEITLPEKPPFNASASAAPVLRLFSGGAKTMSGGEFLKEYRNRIAALPRMDKNPAAYQESLGEEDGPLFSTLLPAAAAIKRRHKELDTGELLERVRAYYLEELDRL